MNTLQTCGLHCHLTQDARNTLDYPWLENWQSPFNTTYAAGDLHPLGRCGGW